jgi:disulfide bond formation protein DsbB
MISLNSTAKASAQPQEGAVFTPLFIGWVISLAATLSALFIGEVMGQTPCVLCWYQRIFMFPLAILLTIASFRSDGGIWRYTLPLAALGWAVAAYHVLVYFEAIPQPITPCSAEFSCSGDAMVLFGSIPIPILSLLSFSAILGSLDLVRRRS